MITRIYRALTCWSGGKQKNRRLSEISPPEDPAAPNSLPESGVVLYCTNWCPDCKKARNWLKQNKIDFNEIDIDQIPHAKDQLRKIAGGNLTTPTFNINGKIVVDFKIRELEEIFNLR